MKKISVLFVLMLSVFMTSAHNLIPIAFCSAGNKVTINATNWDIGNSNTAYLYATLNGSQDSSVTNPVIWRLTVNLSKYSILELNDTVGAIEKSGFKINIPYTISQLYGYENESGPYNKEIWTTGEFNYKSLSNVCVSLPILVNSFECFYQNNSLYFSWKTYSEQDVDHYEIWQQLPNGDSVRVSSVASINSQVAYTYTDTVYLSSNEVVNNTKNIPLQGGLEFGLIGLSLIGMILAYKKNKSWMIGMILLCFSISTSCKKNVQKPQHHIDLSHDIFFLKQVNTNLTTVDCSTRISPILIKY